jgi:N-methylhydantoinase B/oxoprolinase/acetone carboxylase alpha subunit
VKAWGLFGGGDGTNTAIAFRRKGEAEWVRAREAFGTASYGKFSNIIMNEGDEMLFVTPSGGGYGEPFERDPQLVLADYVDELLDAATAATAYGVVIDTDARRVDEEATARLRAERRS